MPHVAIEFDINNPALDEENRNFEISKVLSKLASDIERGLLDESTIIYNTDGDPIGACKFYI